MLQLGCPTISCIEADGLALTSEIRENDLRKKIRHFLLFQQRTTCVADASGRNTLTNSFASPSHHRVPLGDIIIAMNFAKRSGYVNVFVGVRAATIGICLAGVSRGTRLRHHTKVGHYCAKYYPFSFRRFDHRNSQRSAGIRRNPFMPSRLMVPPVNYLIDYLIVQVNFDFFLLCWCNLDVPWNDVSKVL